MNDSKNLILAVALSVLVLVGWTWAANRWFPTVNPPSSKVEAGKQQPLPQPSAQPAGPATSKRLQSVSAALSSSPRVRIETPALSGSINLKGAQIDDLVLLKQRQTIAKDSPPVRLLSPLDTPGAYVAQFGWVAAAGQAPALDAVWTADSQVLTPGRPVTLTTQSGGARYQIRIAVDGGYLFTIQQSVANLSGQPVSVRPIGLVSRSTRSADRSTWQNHTGPIGVFNGAAQYDVNFENLDGQEPGFLSKLFGNSAQPGVNSFNSNGGWLGFTDKYWLTALVPQGGMTGERRLSGRLCTRDSKRRSGPDDDDADPAVCRREGESLARSLRKCGHPDADPRDRLGLVPLVHDRDL